MKIQSLAIIFIIIIIPMSIILSEYLQSQINTINLQTSYDSRLIGATYDAVRAFQLNAVSSSTNDIAASKIRDIEASATTFLTSLANNFEDSGTSRNSIQSYVPAIVYCLYDGYYIYSPYTNDIQGVIENENATYKDGQQLTGVKPYIYYSCRYIKGAIDVVITYSLDNYITIQGTIGGESVNKSGYYLGKFEGTSFNGKYNGVSISEDEGTLRENIFDSETMSVQNYAYAKIQGTKYYLDNNNNVFRLLNGEKLEVSDNNKGEYIDLIQRNNSAYKFYEQAFKFSDYVNKNLQTLTYNDAVDADGNKINANGFSGDRTIFNESGTIKPEDSNSNFTEHRTAVIRYAIEKNLTTAIANYNKNFAQGTAAFAMPNLSETDWYKIINNVSLITFMQGLPIGNKVYNGYAVVTNNKNEDFVAKESIYIVSDGQYHSIGDIDLQSKTTGLKGYINLDFERHTLDQTNYYYPKEETGCYTSIINQTSIDTYDKNPNNPNNDLDEYLTWLKSKNPQLAQAYYTALGRERYGMYRYNKLDE
ncbi:MAG: hypothetical protein IKF17_06120 [Clostridia bacterium]|nr:hypothetical protein [Clostridia bacterium]